MSKIKLLSKLDLAVIEKNNGKKNDAKRYLPLNVLCLCLIMTKYWTS
jgi:hypothetical protein